MREQCHAPVRSALYSRSLIVLHRYDPTVDHKLAAEISAREVEVVVAGLEAGRRFRVDVERIS